MEGKEITLKRSFIWFKLVTFIHILLFVLFVFSLDGAVFFLSVVLLLLSAIYFLRVNACAYVDGDTLIIADDNQYFLLSEGKGKTEIFATYSTEYLNIFRMTSRPSRYIVLLQDSMDEASQRLLRLSFMDV